MRSVETIVSTVIKGGHASRRGIGCCWIRMNRSIPFSERFLRRYDDEKMGDEIDSTNSNEFYREHEGAAEALILATTNVWRDV